MDAITNENTFFVFWFFPVLKYAMQSVKRAWDIVILFECRVEMDTMGGIYLYPFRMTNESISLHSGTLANFNGILFGFFFSTFLWEWERERRRWSTHQSEADYLPAYERGNTLTWIYQKHFISFIRRVLLSTNKWLLKSIAIYGLCRDSFSIPIWYIRRMDNVYHSTSRFSRLFLVPQMSATKQNPIV